MAGPILEGPSIARITTAPAPSPKIPAVTRS
jgi:hypothetical protein